MGMFDQDAGTKGLQKIALLKSLMGKKETPDPPSLSALTGVRNSETSSGSQHNIYTQKFFDALKASDDPFERDNAVNTYRHQMSQIPGVDPEATEEYIGMMTGGATGTPPTKTVLKAISNPSAAGTGGAMMTALGPSKGIQTLKKNIDAFGLGGAAGKAVANQSADQLASDFAVGTEKIMKERYAAAPEHIRAGWGDASKYYANKFSHETLGQISAKLVGEELGTFNFKTKSGLAEWAFNVDRAIDDALAGNPYAETAEADKARTRLKQIGIDEAAGVENADRKFIENSKYGVRSITNFIMGADVEIFGDSMAKWTGNPNDLKNVPIFRAAVKTWNDDMRAGMSVADAELKMQTTLMKSGKYEYYENYGVLSNDAATGKVIPYDAEAVKSAPWVKELVDSAPNIVHAVPTSAGLWLFTIVDPTTGVLSSQTMDEKRAHYLFGDIIDAAFIENARTEHFLKGDKEWMKRDKDSKTEPMRLKKQAKKDKLLDEAIERNKRKNFDPDSTVNNINGKIF